MHEIESLYYNICYFSEFSAPHVSGGLEKSSMSSPFVPISSPGSLGPSPGVNPGVAGDLKSPLNVQMYHQNSSHQPHLNANENNLPLNLPAQPEDSSRDSNG